MWMVPDDMLGVELRPVCFKNTVTGIEFMPHFRLWMWGDDRDLRDIELQRSQRSQVFSDRLRRLGRETNNVITLGIKARAVESLGELEGSLRPLILVHLLQDVLVKTLDAEQRALHAATLPLI